MTVAKVRSLSTPGRYASGPTLYLRIAPGGTKSWVQRLTFAGRRHDIGLGGWPLVSLAEARDVAFMNRRLVRQGGNPLGEKRKATVPTFREASRRALEANRGRWRNRKSIDNWIATMAKYAHPVFGDRRVDQIGTEDVLRVLTPIWSTKPEIGRKVRTRIRQTLAWAQAHNYIEHNPAGEAINAALPATTALKVHFRALAVSRGRGGPGDHRSVAGVGVGEGVSAVRRADRVPERRGPRRDVGRDRPGGPRVAHPWRPHEDGRRASRTALGRGARGPGVGAAVARSVRPAVPVAGATGQGRCPT